MGSVANNKCDGSEIAVTDNGNYLVDLFFETPIEDLTACAKELKETVGVIDHGLFENMVSAVIVATSTGVRVAGPDGEKPWW